ncbi:MAG: hypothetical protein IJE44_02980 [Clostridia bacterium]|nr:hypothetical protein [Clostridia bacterium]
MSLTIKDAEISVEIFQCYVSATLSYRLDGAENGEVFLPFVPKGIIHAFSVSCDGEVFASARAVNLRKLGGALKNSISLLRRIDGAMVLRFSSLPPCEEIEISLSLCFKLSRRANHAQLSFVGLAEDASACANLTFNINGEIEKVSSPTHKITQEVFPSGVRALSEANIYKESFLLDIFFKKAQPDGVIISRHPLRDNVALCTFTPRLSHLLGEKKKFEIYLLPEKDALSKCIAPLSVFLSSLGEGNQIRVFLRDKCVLDFSPLSEKTIDECIENILSSNFCEILSCDKSEKIVIAVGETSFDFGFVPSLTILYGGKQSYCEAPCVCVSEADMGSVIPLEVSRLLSARVSPAFLEPVGGLGVSLVPSMLPEAVSGEVSYCFAKHSVIPPQKIRLFDENWSEKIELKAISTHLNLLPVDIMYAMEQIKALEREKNSLPYEARCVIRDKINEICLSYGIAYGDVALSGFKGDTPLGFIDSKRQYKEQLARYFSEDTRTVAPEILSLLLDSQTTEGIIAKDLFQNSDMLVFSTAVSLIALYLYTKDRYSSFAKRSLEFLKDKEGYWAKTALSLWENGELDLDLLLKRADMKIMYERLDELCVLLIQNFGRNQK